MTVPSEVRSVSYSGNGTTIVFAIPFYFLENSHIKVILRSSTGSETTWVINVDYTLTGAGVQAGGTLTATVAPATGTTLVISRSVPATQETDYPANDPFPSSSHERALDKLTMIVQQNSSGIKGAIRVPDTDPEPARLPTATVRANLLLGFDGSGNPITVAPVSGSAADLATNLANTADVAKGAGQIGRNDQIVNSITELRALLKTSASKFAFVNGYYAAGDGGGGQYYLDAADTTSADNGGTIIVATDGGRWKYASSIPLSLTQWGCKGDGVTDDRVQAQRAVDHATATNGLVWDDLGRNFKLSAPLIVTGSFRSIKFRGVGTGDAQTASSGGSAFLVTGAVNAIEAHFLTFANENIIVEGFNFYNTALDQLTGGTAIKIVRGAANSRYISGFVFRDVGILGFGAAFHFQGSNTVAVENNYIGNILMENVSIQGTGIAFYVKNCVLNLLNMQTVNLLDCKFGGFRLEQDGDVGVGNGKGSAITASLFKCHFEGVGGMFRTQPTAVTGALGTIRNDISLYDFTHESSGTTTGPVAGEPFVLGVNNDIHIFGKVDYGIAFGEVSLPRLNSTSTIESTTRMRVWMDGGRNRSPLKVNAPTYFRTILNGNNTVITVGIDQADDFAIRSNLILGGGNAGVIDSLHQGNSAGAPVRTAIAGAPTAGITLTWAAVAGAGAIQLTVDNASGFTVTAELAVENLSSASITAASEV